MTIGFRFAIVVGSLIVLSVVGWVAYVAWQNHREAPLRQAISALKEDRGTDALRLLMPLAEAGHPLAQETVGEIYAYGLGVPIDPIRAGIWYRKAEWSSRVAGQNEYEVGRSFLLGRPPAAKDLTRASFWLQRAAEAGHVEAQKILANPDELSRQGIAVDPGVTSYWSRFLHDR